MAVHQLFEFSFVYFHIAIQKKVFRRVLLHPIRRTQHPNHNIETFFMRLQQKMLTKTGEQHHPDSWVLHDNHQSNTKKCPSDGKSPVSR
jgi:hypothetical protein